MQELKYVDGQGILDAGDIDEAMNAAHAVGDDTLQQEAYGRTVPDSFTHGTSEQRKNGLISVIPMVTLLTPIHSP